MTDDGTFNLNDYVLIRLTDVGRESLRNQHEVLRRQGVPLRVYKPPREDANGWSRWQLWSLMDHFGALTYLGCPVPFETTIRIERRKVERRGRAK